MIKLIDSHCHLDDEKLIENKDTIIQNLRKEEIDFIGIGYNVESSKKEIEIARENDTYVAIGISPNDIDNSIEKIDEQILEIEKLVERNLSIVVAIGEIGLDYYWCQENKELQKYAFVKQIKLANKFNLPITIHQRDAHIDCIELLKENEVKAKGIFHCCQQNMELIKQINNLQFYISFAGPITFKNAKKANEIIKQVPKDKILVETDSPYLTPEPFRGKLNTPVNVKYVAKKIADTLNMDINDVYKMTKENTINAYKIKGYNK